LPGGIVDYVAVFVDAGCLFAAGSDALSGKVLPRGATRLDLDDAVEALKDIAERASGGLRLLRIYWYDGTQGAPTLMHRRLARHAHVKVRLGIVDSRGQQKGVDSLLVTDMIALARNRAMTECVLLSGDEDVRVGVQQAQEYGIRVHLLGVGSGDAYNQSDLLVQEADEHWFWKADDLKAFLTIRLSTETDGARPRSPEEVDRRLLEVARTEAAEVPAAEREKMSGSIRRTGLRPKEIDRRLLGRAAGEALDGGVLSEEHKRRVRDAFLESLVGLHEVDTDAASGCAPEEASRGRQGAASSGQSAAEQMDDEHADAVHVGEEPALDAGEAAERLVEVARSEAESVPAGRREELIRHIEETGYRPREVDAALLARCSREALGGRVLDESQRKQVRDAFSAALRELLQAAAEPEDE